MTRIFLLINALVLAGCGSTLRLGEADGAVAVIDMPQDFEVVAFDGQNAKPRLMLGGGDSYRVEVPAGGHDISLKYEQVWKLNAADHQVVRSAPLRITAAFEAGRHYRIDYARPADLDAAQRYAANPVLRLVESDSGTPIRQETLPEQDATPVAQLRHWWRAASAAEQRAFLDWVGTQAR